MGSFNGTNFRKTVYYFRRNGLKNTWYAMRERLEEQRAEVYRFVEISQECLEAQRRSVEEWDEEDHVRFSIVVPAYCTPKPYLEDMLSSVLAQSYPYWELIVADATEDDSVEREVKAHENPQIRYIRLKENGGISRNTDQALSYVTGSYIGLLDHDDVLTPDALYEMAEQIRAGKRRGIALQMLYSDEDKCDGDRTRYYEVNRKEDFNLDLLLSNNYVCHFLVMKSELMQSLGFRREYEGAQDYDLILRAAGQLMVHEERIAHIPKVLYHWRCHGGSTAQNPKSKAHAYDAGRRAVQDFADRMHYKARAVSLPHLGFYTLEYSDSPLRCREDLGAVGGRILRKGKIAGGRMDVDGRILYEGLSKHYSGYLHRAALTQDADAVDIRCMQVREECRELFQMITGVPYVKTPDIDCFDAHTLPEGTDYIDLSLRLCRAIREKGYRILYLPGMSGGWKA